jgi:Cu(I)/Ag(I) efflux system membrane fusion protein
MKTFIVTLSLAAALMISSCGKPASSHQEHADSTAAGQTADYYTCPMHPQVHMEKPGVCPICGMDLVKASNGRTMDQTSDEPMIPLNDREQILANVSTVPVGYEPIDYTIRAFGTMEIPEPNNTVISARFNGRIEKLYVNAVGATIKKGQPLFDIYSPDIIQAANDYRQVITTNSHTGGNLAAIAKSKLTLLGLTDDQISNLDAQTPVPLVFTYYSPASGTIIDKNIVEGIYVTEGTSLYNVSDISRLWNIAEVYESDAAQIRAGERATISIAGFPEKQFPAVVSLVYPVVNPQTRTVKVRLTVNAMNEPLKPNMYTETVFHRSMGRSLTVPVGAVLITGKQNMKIILKRAKSGSAFDFTTATK